MVDALASGASIRKDVEVRVLSWAPIAISAQALILKGATLRKMRFVRNADLSSKQHCLPGRRLPKAFRNLAAGPHAGKHCLGSRQFERFRHRQSRLGQDAVAQGLNVVSL